LQQIQLSLLVRFDWRVADELVAFDAEVELLSKHVGSWPGSVIWDGAS
jgi:hypothetical protein